MDEVRRLLAMTWPIVVGQLGMMMLGLVDAWMVGQLGARELAAVTLANGVSFSAIVVGIGTAIGLDPLIAQAQGAGDQPAVDRALARGLVLLLGLSVPIVAVHFALRPVLVALSQPPGLLDLASSYALAVAPSAPAFILFVLLRQAMQARGLFRPVMWIVLAANLLNVVCNLVLIHGLGPVPPLGVVGAGLSTALSRFAMLAAVVWVAMPEREALRRGLADGMRWEELARVGRVALPVGWQVGLEVWAFNLAIPMVGWFGEVSVAAHTVALTFASMAFQVPLALGSAAAARVGNLVGEGADWAGAGWTAIRLGSAWGLVSSTLLVVLGVPLSASFLPGDPAAVALAASLIPLAAAFQVFDAAQVVSFGVLRGAGDTQVPSVANIVGYYAIGLPLGAWLAVEQGWEARGVWAGLVVGLVGVSALLLLRVAQIQRRGAARVRA